MKKEKQEGDAGVKYLLQSEVVKKNPKKKKKTKKNPIFLCIM